MNVHELQLRQRQRAPGRFEVDLLPAGHAARAGRERQDLHHFELRARFVGDAVLGQQLEGERLQRVAHQQRRSLVVLDVQRRLAAPENVVVHAGQVIVHQRIGVDQLDRGRCDLDPLRACIGQLAGGECQQRPHALAALQRGIAHGFVQARRRKVRLRQQTRKRRFHPRLDCPHPGSKAGLSLLHRLQVLPRQPAA